MSAQDAVAALGACAALGGLAAAAAHDLAVRTIPNRLALLVAAGALLQALMTRQAAGALAMVAGLFALSSVLWLRGWLGGGDAKLLAAAAPLVAPARMLDLLLAVALAGGVLALPYLPGRRLFARPRGPRPPGLLARLIRCERWRLSRRGPLPYGIAIAAGILLVLLRKG